MSTLQQIEAAGLTSDFETAISEKFIKNNPASKEKKQQLKELIDAHGLQHNEVMKLVGALQRNGFLKHGLYRDLKAIRAKLDANGEPAGASEPQQTQEPVEMEEVQEESTEELGEVAEESDAADSDSDVAVDITDVDNEKIKDRIRKENEKHQKRIAAMAKKMKEAASKKAKAKREKLGLKAEEAARINELKKLIGELQQEKKDHQLKVQQLNQQIKQYKTEIQSIRPKNATTITAKPAAKSEFTQDVIDSAKKSVLKFLARNPASKSPEIVDHTNLDPKLYVHVRKALVAEGLIVQAARGPNANYSVA